ncbi:hypothetical protein KIJ96_21405 (plasmid) [Pseudoalteromonas piscicida]|uniref:hypothetical protein n=1 Tax=Pseudoalteromonas piscicida TaxID=43662 RepID=UPI001D0A3E9B|nr:hypothetical protein [Pseudoalteromonas piscicida]UDM63518.1 hypothetical protein KIJ96_21405 [Pseudoalteromonas piscicida]
MEKFCISIISLCLALGGVTHIFDNVYFGLLPYKFAPNWVNLYWTSLGIIDFLAIYILLKNRNLGVILTLIIMISDVVINSAAYYSMQVIKDPIALQLQTLFLGFCLGACMWLWKSNSSNSVSPVT